MILWSDKFWHPTRKSSSKMYKQNLYSRARRLYTATLIIIIRLREEVTDATRRRVDRVRGARMRVRVTRFAQTSWSRFYQANMDTVEATTDEQPHPHTHVYIHRGPRMYVYTRACPTRAGAYTAHSRVALGDFSHREIAIYDAMRFPALRSWSIREAWLSLTGSVLFFISDIPRYYKHQFF